MKKGKILCALLAAAALAFPADAAKEEWADAYYDWGGAKSVAFTYTVAPEIQDGRTERMTKQLFEELLQKKFLAKRGKHAARMAGEETEPAPSAPAAKKFPVAKGVGKDAWEQAVKESAAPPAPVYLDDLAVDVTLSEYRMDSVYHEGYYETVSVPHTERFKGPDGKEHKRTWYTEEERYVEPYYEQIAYVTLDAEAKDGETGQTVWVYKDFRDRSYGNSNNHTPQKMYKRTVDDFFDALLKKYKEAEKRKGND